jgi:single-strand DNA-binding protein
MQRRVEIISFEDRCLPRADIREEKTMLNRIVLIGRLTADPETQYTASGVAITKFRIAVDRPTKDPETGEKETDFINIVAWRRTAEFAANYLRKGRLVAVEGRLQIRSWDAQDGTKRYTTEVVADNVEGLDRPREAEGAPAEEGYGYSAPRAAASPASATSSATAPPVSAPARKPAPPAIDDLDDTDPFADD